MTHIVAVNVQIIDASTFPDEHVSPKVKLTMVFSMLLGLLFSCGYILLKELMHKTIRNEDDIKRYLEIPILGVIPDEESLNYAKQMLQQPKEVTWRDKLKEFIWKN